MPKHVTQYLRSWLQEHVDHPYPSEDEKRALAEHTNLNMNQISNWFINARRRILAPQEAQRVQEAVWRGNNGGGSSGSDRGSPESPVLTNHLAPHSLGQSHSQSLAHHGLHLMPPGQPQQRPTSPHYRR